MSINKYSKAGEEHEIKRNLHAAVQNITTLDGSTVINYKRRQGLKAGTMAKQCVTRYEALQPYRQCAMPSIKRIPRVGKHHNALTVLLTMVLRDSEGDHTKNSSIVEGQHKNKLYHPHSKRKRGTTQKVRPYTHTTQGNRCSTVSISQIDRS